MANASSRSTSAQDAEIELRVIEAISLKTGGPVGRNDPIGILELDSLALAEVSVDIEKTIGVRLDDGILDALTVGDIVDYVIELKHRSKSP